MPFKTHCFVFSDIVIYGTTSATKGVVYELTTHLLVSAENGCPLAPIQMHLKTANGYLSTAETVPASDDHHLAQVLPLMRDAAAMELPTTLVHVIDREADSVFHFREWQAAGFLFLVRGKDWHVRWQGELVKYSTIEKRLEMEGAFRPIREMTIKGKSGVQYVAEVDVVLDRPATRKVNRRMVSIPGEAIALRLVMARVVNPASGEVLSTWYLLTNVPSEVAHYFVGQKTQKIAIFIEFGDSCIVNMPKTENVIFLATKHLKNKGF